MNDKKIYSLAISKGKNNIWPIDLKLLSDCKKNLTSLEEIDSYTSAKKREDFIQNLLDENLINEDERDYSIAIVYKEDNNTKWIPEGPCFINNSEFLDRDNIINYIITNITDLQLMNKLYNYYSKYVETRSKEYSKFVESLNFVHTVVKENNENKLNSLCNLIKSYFKELNYEEIRCIGMYISKKIINEKDKTKPLTYNIDDRRNKNE